MQQVREFETNLVEHRKYNKEEKENLRTDFRKENVQRQRGGSYRLYPTQLDIDDDERHSGS